MSYWADSEFLFIAQNNEQIQKKIEHLYPGINVSISVDFMNQYKKVYVHFRYHLIESLAKEIEFAQRKWQPDPFKKEMEKFVSLPEETKVMILYLFDTWVEFDKLSTETSWYLAGCLSLLFFYTSQYNDYIKWCEEGRNMDEICHIDIKKDSLKTMAEEIIEISPGLWKKLNPSFIWGYLHNLDTKTKALHEGISQPQILDLRSKINLEISKIHQAKIDSRRVNSLIN